MNINQRRQQGSKRLAGNKTILANTEDELQQHIDNINTGRQ